MEDRSETGSALDRLTERLEGVGEEQVRHGGRLHAFENGLHGVRADVVQLREGITDVRQKVAGLESAVSDTRQVLDTFIEQYGRDREMARAQAELARLTTVFQADFAQRKQTRALARGLVHTLTAHAVRRKLVNTNTLRSCVEERLLLEPTYWLAPAIMAVAANFRDETAPGERAQAHACTLDAAKANLFFALTSSRLGNEAEAAAWMDTYLQSLDPEELGQDFCVVLDAIASNELGEDALSYTRQAMAGWNQSMHRTSASSAQWGTRLRNLRRQLSDKEYTALRETCADQWDSLRDGWELATVPEGTVAYLRRIFPDGPDGVDRTVSDGCHVETALERLINQLEPDEAHLHEQMQQLERIIEYGGDLEAAAQAHKSPLSPETEPVPFMTLLDQAVFAPDTAPLGPPARRMALRAIWPSLEKAADRVVAESRNHLPDQIALSIAGYSWNLPTHPHQTVKPGPLVDDLAARLEQETQARSDAVVRRWPRVCVALLFGLITGTLVVPFLDGASKYLFLLLTVIAAIWIVWEIGGVPLRKKHVREQGDQRRHEAVTTLAKALQQREDFFTKWHEGIQDRESLTRWGGHSEQQ
ncbi:hypothetical protein [Streptomyces sp. BV129]|uniref:hypothetical protein n=1 Tax=Streptomyces sp. BV129 TaxID=2849671 RepID=UPI001C2E1332|nr:hypothetical protein [Streptomyces sp. BV129]MBV1949187.1 hypothetical protein [Streptomyces sp. BV129]